MSFCVVTHQLNARLDRLDFDAAFDDFVEGYEFEVSLNEDESSNECMSYVVLKCSKSGVELDFEFYCERCSEHSNYSHSIDGGELTQECGECFAAQTVDFDDLFRCELTEQHYKKELEP